MTCDETLFPSFIPTNEEEFVASGDNSKWTNLGFGAIGKSPNPTIREVLLVKGLRHNLLNLSQLWDK